METSFYLNNIANLANSDRGQFSITPDGGYYRIAVGEHAYLVLNFSLESLMSANVGILVSIRVKEGW